MILEHLSSGSVLHGKEADDFLRRVRENEDIPSYHIEAKSFDVDQCAIKQILRKFREQAEV